LDLSHVKKLGTEEARFNGAGFDAEWSHFTTNSISKERDGGFGGTVMSHGRVRPVRGNAAEVCNNNMRRTSLSSLAEIRKRSASDIRSTENVGVELIVDLLRAKKKQSALVILLQYNLG
jgi:hypothetical protein